MQHRDVAVSAVQGSGPVGDGGVVGGDLLLRFTEASVGPDPDALTAARDDVAEHLGEAVLVDAAAVASAFQMMNRLANATGTPLDEQLVGMTSGVRNQLDLDYLSAESGLPARYS